MATTVINVADPRDVKALKILATSDDWKEHLTSPLGGKAYEIRSLSDPAQTYFVDLHDCTCADSRFRGGRCAYIRAVRLYVKMVRSYQRRHGLTAPAPKTGRQYTLS
jgi:hypothetical protein